MDFHLSEEQQAVAEAARRVIDGHATSERVQEVEASEDRVDRRLWSALAEAELLSLALPAEDGGGGLGLTELCLLLEAQGRRVAPVPLWATLVLGALPIARYGSEALRRRLLPAVAKGEAFLSAALTEVAGGAPRRPGVTAEQGPDGAWRVSGTVEAVPYAHVADAVVVPAVTGRGELLLAVVDPRTDAEVERAVTTNREVHPHLHLREAKVGVDEVLVAPPGAQEALEWLRQVALTGLCALAVGVAEAAVAATAAYLNERHQFGRALSTFQGTMLRSADAYIDTEAMRVTLWQAAWRLDTDREAAGAVEAAAWQAKERGQRVVHATQHLHGGVGADISYPIHRYFLWGKQLELLLGGPSSQRSRLGHRIAEEARSTVTGAT
jgi:alkylation response protein AidB-like acyl-CoA dehydrogenase